MEGAVSHQCRLCTKDSKFGYSLLVEDLIEVIESFTPIKIKESDNLPSHCCAQCLEDVYSVLKIRCRIIESDRVLREKQSTAVACKVESDETSPPASPPTPPPIDHIAVDVMIKEDTVEEDKQVLTIYKAAEVSNRRRQHFECNKCNETFTLKHMYKRHMSTHDINIKEFKKCEVCEREVLSCNYRRHLDLHKAVPQICELCGALAKNAESLRGHMFYMHRSTAEQYQCKLCGKFYRYKYKFQLHLRKAHGGDKSHTCEICGKSFYTARDVNRHIQMTHLKLRPYICSYCNKGFSSAYARSTHVRQHTNEKPFKCDICAEGFRQRVSLKTHLKSKHGILYINQENSIATDDAVNTDEINIKTDEDFVQE